MDILGVGPLEIVFILIIALIVLGPRDMAKAGRTIGRSLRKIVTSPSWQAVQQTSREIRNLPNRLIREAGLEDMKNHLPDPENIKSQLNLKELQEEISGAIQPEFLEGTHNASDEEQNFSDWISPPESKADVKSQKNDEDTIQHID
ncbi:MAG: twin-arginine translocase TatA/TatE family subunit [Anaerolineales bacterium]|jgi:Sec-independent protein translocase protein TatA